MPRTFRKKQGRRTPAMGLGQDRESYRRICDCLRHKDGIVAYKNRNFSTLGDQCRFRFESLVVCVCSCGTAFDLMMTPVRFPALETDVARFVSPGEVLLDGGLWFLVGAEVRVFQGELAKRPEMALDPVQPRGVAGGEPDAVSGSPLPDLLFAMVAGVVQHEEERSAVAIPAPKPSQEPQELDPVPLLREAAERTVRLAVVGPDQVADAPARAWEGGLCAGAGGPGLMRYPACPGRRAGPPPSRRATRADTRRTSGTARGSSRLVGPVPR